MNRGLYIHIPFCKQKCAYCDFYSFSATDEQKQKYLFALIEELDKYKNYAVDTLYIGGGTPSLLGAEYLEKLLFAVNKKFGNFREATIEVNPADNLLQFFKTAKAGGINRISMGVQSGIEGELKALSRRHSLVEVERAIGDCKRAGINNISLDLMLGIPDQTLKTLKDSIEFLCSLEPTHISAYILKLEPNTPLYNAKNINLPDSDLTAEMYLLCVEELEKRGFLQYEISNFAKEGFQSFHNLKYWKAEEYIGVGPSAHGFLEGRRYYYPRDIKKFITAPEPVFEGVGGNADEYIMLGLRLKTGIDYGVLEQKFKLDTTKMREKATLFKKYGLCNFTQNGFSLTPKGFLVSNTIITEFLETI